MKWLRLVPMAALAGRLTFGADARGGAPVPPVLRPSEPADSLVVRLPGPRPAAARPRRVFSAPVPHPAVLAPPPLTTIPDPPLPVQSFPEAATVITPAPIEFLPSPPETGEPLPSQKEPGEPQLSPQETAEVLSTPQTKPALPEDFVQEGALYFQKRIGQWTEADARRLLGEPLRERPAFADGKNVNGRIYAFSDPSGRYKELELDFREPGGTLRSVFAYPAEMTWAECRRLWSGDVAVADARQGRTFYSYLKRRLDVLVDQNGKVISLGLY